MVDLILVLGVAFLFILIHESIHFITAVLLGCKCKMGFAVKHKIILCFAVIPLEDMSETDWSLIAVAPFFVLLPFGLIVYLFTSDILCFAGLIFVIESLISLPLEFSVQIVNYLNSLINNIW